MQSRRAQFANRRLHLKNLLDVLIFCSVNFALVISLFKFGGCRLLLVIFDVERASRIVWSLVKMCMLFLKNQNISVLFGLKVETYGSTSSSFLVCVHVLKSESLGIDLASFMPSEITVSG